MIPKRCGQFMLILVVASTFVTLAGFIWQSELRADMNTPLKALESFSCEGGECTVSPPSGAQDGAVCESLPWDDCWERSLCGCLRASGTLPTGEFGAWCQCLYYEA